MGPSFSQCLPGVHYKVELYFLLRVPNRRLKRWTKEQRFSFQNEIYWDDWSQLSIFRASKYSGSQMVVLASQLTGLMDMKIFYKGKTTGKAMSPS